MQSISSHIDDLLIHCYWLDYNSKNLLDAHSNLQLLAVACLLKKTNIKKVVILGGKIDLHRKSLGKIIYQELSKKIDRKLASKIIVVPNSLTTRQEVRGFRKLVEKNHWHNIASLCLSVQLPRVKRAYKRIFSDKHNQIGFVKTEDMLNQLGYEKEVAEYTNSKELKLLKLNEILVGTINGIPIIGGYLIDIMIKIFPWKGVFLSKIFSVGNK